MNALGTPQFEPARASDELEDVGLRLSLPVTMNRARSGRFLPGLQLPSKLMAQDMFESRRRVMLSFERQPFPGACHVDQDVPHSQVWRALGHLTTFDRVFSALHCRNHLPVPPALAPDAATGNKV
jgi:hypothetical protein